MSDTAAAPALNSRATPQDPWLGLESYSEAESAWFFGRNPERDELLRVIERDLLTVVYGPSGSGKTSLLSAGVFPLLRKKHYLPLRIRLEHGPEAPSAVTQIKQRLLNEIEHRKLKESPLFDPLTTPTSETLWEYLHRVDFWDPATGQFITPVILLDQFEELFTLGAARKDELLDDLVALLEDAKAGPRYKLILTLRQEYLYLLDPLRRRAPAFMHNRYLLGPMKGESALQAVERPGAEVVTPAVAQDIVRFVVGGKSDPLNELEVEPVLLSLFCRELNEGRKSRRAAQITTAQLMDEQADILTNFYESSFNGLDPATRPFIEDRLLTSTGNRTSAPEDDASNAGVPTADLNQLESRRLIRREQHLQRPHLELTHDILTKPAAESRRIRRERQAAEQARRLLRLSRRRNVIAIAIAVAFVVIASFALWGLFRERSEATKGLARELAAYSLASISEDPERAVLLALHAAQTTLDVNEPVLEIAEAALHRSVIASRVYKTFIQPAATWSVAVNADATLAASGSNDGSLRLWEIRSGRLIRSIQTENGPIRAVSLSPDARYVATASADGSAHLWIPSSAVPIRMLTRSKRPLNTIAFSPDGRFIAVAGEDRLVSILDVNTGTLRATLVGHEAAVTRTVFSPEGKHILTSSVDGRAIVWNFPGPNIARIFIGHRSGLWCADFSPDGRYIVTGSTDETVALWDIKSGKRLHLLQGHLGSVLSAAFSPDGKRVASAGYDRNIRVWDVSSGRQVDMFAGHQHAVNQVVWSRDSRFLLSASLDRTIRIWETAPPHHQATIDAHLGIVLAVAFSPDSKFLLTGGLDGTARLWDVASHQQTRVLLGHTAAVRSVAFSPNGRLALTGGWDGAMKIWNLASGEVLEDFRGSDKVNSVAFSPDGNSFAAAFDDGTIQIRGVYRRDPSLSMRAHSSSINSVRFSPNGRLFLTGSSDQTAGLFDTRSGMRVRTFRSDQALIFDVAFHPVRPEILTGSYDQTARLWDAETSRGLRVFSGHRGEVKSVSFDQRGRRILTASDDGTARVWDAATGKELITLPAHASPVNSAVFSPNGKLAASAGEDGLIQIYAMDISDLMALARKRVTRPFTPAECERYFQSATCPPFP